MAHDVTPKIVAIVDDDESVRASLLDFLEFNGLTAHAFASAEEFLASGQQRNTGCLIADIRMPGMSGLALQAELNSGEYSVPTIFITAHGDEDMRIRAMRAGAVLFLAKPYDDEVLLERVRACLQA